MFPLGVTSTLVLVVAGGFLLLIYLLKKAHKEIGKQKLLNSTLKEILKEENKHNEIEADVKRLPDRELNKRLHRYSREL